MNSVDTFKSKKTFKIDNQNYIFFDLGVLETRFDIKLSQIPYTKKILLENLLRHEDGETVNDEMIINLCNNLYNQTNAHEIVFYPTRVLMQDFTGVPAIADLAAMRDACKERNLNPELINPVSRTDLIIDHSVMVDSFGKLDSFDKNVKEEFKRNKERYEFLKWGQESFDNFHLVPPGAGICHQVNLENIAKTVWLKNIDNQNLIFPDSVVGTDSHTTMINALSVLGWGVGGIEAEAVMLGEPISLNFPKVVGFKIIGSLNEGVTATDVVLNITKVLRAHGVVGKFVEFFGDGLKNLSLADRATIANMSPEYGATCGFFPVDQESLKYLRLTGRNKHHLNIVSEYTKKQKLWNTDAEILYDETLNFNLNDVEPTIAGPKRPQDKISLKNVSQSFSSLNLIKKDKSENKELIQGDIVIAAITSCTNTSNPYVMIAAGLLAKKAVELGIKVKPWVKTSLAPGSKVVTDYLNKSNLTKYLNNLGFNLVGYGCTTCIGNSGPLDTEFSKQIVNNKLTVCSVLSGNRNFEGRIHQEVKANYLASPPLVVAYALAGNISIDLTKDPIGKNYKNKSIYLKDLWPSSREIEEIMNNNLNKELFINRYEKIYDGDENWKSIKSIKSITYNWNHSSTYIKPPPFFKIQEKNNINEIKDASVLAMLGDSVTTDHISPAGSIQFNSSAGKYLSERQINQKEFNSYGSRRGNHEVMMRGTFANIRIRNQIVPNSEGGITKCFLNGEETSIFEAASEYLNKDIPLVVLAGKEYGTGSSRDWAAKGTRLLGVKAVVAESFERIHRSNLIGMGVLPLEFTNSENIKNLNISGEEKFSFKKINLLEPRKIIECLIKKNGTLKKINLLCRIETKKELAYFKAGGILQYILDNIDKKSNNI